MGHRLSLAARTQISVLKSPFPSAGTAVSLFRAKTESWFNAHFVYYIFNLLVLHLQVDVIILLLLNASLLLVLSTD